MILTFSGSREGMTEAQYATVLGELVRLRPALCRHGACVGADSLFVRLVHVLRPRPRLHAYPSTYAGLVCPDAIVLSDKQFPPADALARNRTMLTGADRLIATPKEYHDPRKGGTWYSIRYGRSTGVPVTLVLPDGAIELS